MRDVVVVGQVARDLVLGVEELPGPGGSVPVRHRWEGLGGKGANQALACCQLGLSAALVGVVGDDRAGADVLVQARADGLDVRGVVRREGASTALLLDVVERGATRRLLEDVGPGVLLRPDDVRRSAGLLADARAVLLQLQQPPDAVREALHEARRGGALVVADGAPDDQDLRGELLGAVEVLRADAHEAELLVGRDLPDLDAVLDAARELVAGGPRVVVLAAGAAGNVVAWLGGVATVPLVDVVAADPTGGGDSFTSALTVALLRGESPAAAVRWASAAAALTVARLGGRPGLSPAAVEDLVQRTRSGDASG